MSTLARICVARPIFAVMLIAALVVAGLVAFPNLGVDRFPNIDLPTVLIRTSYPGAAGAEVESEVTQVIEDAVAGVTGISELRSISSDSSSFVIVTFELDRDIDSATQDVRDAVSSVLNLLPTTVDPPLIRQSDTDDSPILSLALSGPRSARELYYYADRYVKNTIESVQGVGAIEIAGSAERAIRIAVDNERLAAHQMSILQVREAVASQNAELPGGRVDEGLIEQALRVLGRVPDADAFRNLVIETTADGPVRLADLADVYDDTKEVRTLARLNGQPAVVLSIVRQRGQNTVAVIDAIKAKLPRAESLLPEDLQLTVIGDQSRYILAALHEIESHLISGSILACITVFAFMRSWRSTIIAAVAIPTSIVATFAFMKAFGFTLNNVTMLALVLMVGVVIDDAIVVLENIFRFVEEKGMSPMAAAVAGTKDISLAVLATTLSLVIVFLPVSFLSSVTGRLLFEFGVTATIAILISMFVSFTLTPMMCSRLLRPVKPAAGENKPERGHQAASRRGIYGWIEAAYMATLRQAMRFRFITLLLIIATIASNFWLLQLVRQDYIPTDVDEAEFEVSITGAEGSTLSVMDDAMERAEERIAANPGVRYILTTVGSRGIGGLNRGSVYVRLVDAEERTFNFSRLWAGLLAGDPAAAWRGNFSQQDFMGKLRGQLKEIPGIRASVRNLTSLRQGAPVDIDFTLTGPSISKLGEYSERLREKTEKIPGIVDLDTTLRLDKPELHACIDRERAAAMGVNVREIAETLRVAVGGDDRISRYRDESIDDAYDVEMRLTNFDRNSPSAIEQLYVRSAAVGSLTSTLRGNYPALAVAPEDNTSMVRLDNLITFDYQQATARIDRLDRQRMVAVRGNIAAGYALADRIAAVQAAADELGMEPGFESRVAGRGRELETTLEEFKWLFVLSFVFMYIVLAAQFEHLLHPLTILLTLPLAVPFGLLSLLWGGQTLNVYSALGLLVLFGVVKKAGILQIDHINTLRAEGVPRDEAIMIGNRDRLRPILMTTVSFVAGLLPLLIATGPGAEERKSIAVLAVGGQTFSLLLTLLAVPVIYSYWDDLAKLIRRTPPSDVSTAP